jgi:acetate---CoA ligase (ADP-forming)
MLLPVPTIPVFASSIGVLAGAYGLAHTGRGRIASIDLNPVMVRARGEGAVVADALVELVQDPVQ